MVRERESQHVPDAFLHAYTAGELSAVERSAEDRHVAACDACRSALGRIAATAALFTAKPEEPSELAWRRIEKRVAEQLAEDAGGRMAEATIRGGRGFRRAIAAIASLAAAMLVGLWVGLRIDRGPRPDDGARAPATELAAERGARAERVDDAPAIADRSGSESSDATIDGPTLEPRALRTLADVDPDRSITTPPREGATRERERSIGYVGDRADPGAARSSGFGQTRVEVEAPSDPLAALWLETTKAYYEARDIPRALTLAKRIVAEGGARPEVALAEEILCDGYIATRQARSAVAACQAILRRAEAAGLEERARAIHYQIGTIHRVELGDCAAAMYHYGRSVVFGRTSMLDDEALMWRVDCAIQLGDENSARRDLALLQRTDSRPGRRERLEALEARFEQMLEASAQPGDRPRGRSQPVDDTR